MNDMENLEAEVASDLSRYHDAMVALKEARKSFMQHDARCIELKRLMKERLEKHYVLPPDREGKINSEKYLFNFLVTMCGVCDFLESVAIKIKKTFPNRDIYLRYSSHDGMKWVSIVVPYNDDDELEDMYFRLDIPSEHEDNDFNVVVGLEPLHRVKKYSEKHGKSD